MTIQATSKKTPTEELPEANPGDPAETIEAVTEPPRSAEEILRENDDLRQAIEEHGAKDILKSMGSTNRERMLKPFQAELILMQKYLEESQAPHDHSVRGT